MNFPFYIAKRYLFSKKSHNAINVISAISVCGVALATLLSQNGSLNRKCGGVNCLRDYFGITRQGYYKHVDRHSELNVLETSIVLYCKELKDAMPNAGMRELYACCVRHFKEKMVIGRDRCYELLRSNGLVLRKKHKRPKTTNSNHNYYGRFY